MVTVNERIFEAADWYRRLTVDERVQTRAIPEIRRRFGLKPKDAVEALRQAQEARYAPE